MKKLFGTCLHSQKYMDHKANFSRFTAIFRKRTVCASSQINDKRQKICRSINAKRIYGRVLGTVAGVLAAALICTGGAGCVGRVESYGDASDIYSEVSEPISDNSAQGYSEEAYHSYDNSNPGADSADSFQTITDSPADTNTPSYNSDGVVSEVSDISGTTDKASESLMAENPSESEVISPTSSGKPVSSSSSVRPADESRPVVDTRPADSARPVSSSEPQGTDNTAQPVDKSGVFFSWSAGSTWKEGGNICGTCELTIKNDSDLEVGEWRVTFDVPEGFKISNSWNGNFSVKGTMVSVTNVEYNGNIPVGGSVSFGFNYGSPAKFTPPDTVGFNGTRASSPGGANQGGSPNDNGNNTQNNDGNNNTPAPTGDIQTLLKRSPEAKQGDDWLYTDGNRILDKSGKQVWLTGVNWFGYNTGTNTFDGLWNSNLCSSVKGIADHGFNLIRVPISAELLNQWSSGEYPRANYNNAMNTELNDMNSLQIFDYFLKLAEENGVKVMPDIHCAETDAMGHNVNLWYTDKVTAEDYYHALEWLAERYKDNDTIIAIDIKNEPHGKPNESNKAIWNNSKDKNNWKYTAETAAKKILAKNPNLLIMVEGTEIYSKNKGDYSSSNSADYYYNWWGGNLRGVKDYPIDLGKYQNKLVYSPHDYGPTVYEQPWFKGGYDYDSLIRDCWQDNWLYIHKDNTAPLLIGEWGGFMREPNLTWMTCMRRLIKEYHLNHTFWCYNANSGDTGGLVLDDFSTWDTEKYNFVKEVLWRENGKFVGLDHEIPLGENGITLTDAKGL